MVELEGGGPSTAGWRNMRFGSDLDPVSPSEGVMLTPKVVKKR